MDDVVHTTNVRERSLNAIDARIAELERELAEMEEDVGSDAATAARANTGKRRRNDSSAGAGASSKARGSLEPDAPLGLWCEVCSVGVTSIELMREHLGGKRHMQEQKKHDAKSAGRFCETCSLAFTSSAQMTEHLKGRKHKEAAREASSAVRSEHERERRRGGEAKAAKRKPGQASR